MFCNMLLCLLLQRSEEDAKNMHPACICVLILCMWDQYQTTIWILESAVPSCLGNMNQSFPSTDFSYCENLFLLRGLQYTSRGQAGYEASRANKTPHFQSKNTMKNYVSPKKKHIISS